MGGSLNTKIQKLPLCPAPHSRLRQRPSVPAAGTSLREEAAPHERLNE